MILKEIKKSRGALSTIILVLIIIVVIALIIAFFVARRNQKPAVTKPVSTEPPPPVYNVKINNINFTLLEDTNLGNILYGKESSKPKYQKDLETTERFIQVTIGAQNSGTVNTKKTIWGVGNIIDDHGRNYIPKAFDKVENWLPAGNTHNCSSILEPIFTPTSCIRIYDVANGAENLKIQVYVLKGVDTKERTTELLDLKPTY